MSARLLALAATLLLLAGCSRAPILTFEIDLVPLLGSARSGAFLATVGGADLPDADGLASDELGLPVELYASLRRVGLTGEGVFELAGPAPVTVTLALFVADGPSAFAAGDPVTLSLPLQPGVATELPFGFVLSEEQSRALFERLRDGDFRLGLRVSASGSGTVSYQLDGFEVAVGLLADALLPF